MNSAHSLHTDLVLSLHHSPCFGLSSMLPGIYQGAWHAKAHQLALRQASCGLLSPGLCQLCHVTAAWAEPEPSTVMKLLVAAGICISSAHQGTLQA